MGQACNNKNDPNCVTTTYAFLLFLKFILINRERMWWKTWSVITITMVKVPAMTVLLALLFLHISHIVCLFGISGSTIILTSLAVRNVAIRSAAKRNYRRLHHHLKRSIFRVDIWCTRQRNNLIVILVIDVSIVIRFLSFVRKFRFLRDTNDIYH